MRPILGRLTVVVGAFVACTTTGLHAAGGEPDHLQIRIVAEEGDSGSTESLPERRKKNQVIKVLKKVELDESDMAEAMLSLSGEDLSNSGIELRFTKNGAQSLKKLTTANVKKRLAFVYNGQVVAVLVIDRPVTGAVIPANDLDEATVEKIISVVERNKVPN